METPDVRSGLTIDELDRSERAAAKGLYNDVRPETLFGPRADGRLAAEIWAVRPLLYRELKRQHQINIGAIRAPLPEV